MGGCGLRGAAPRAQHEQQRCQKKTALVRQIREVAHQLREYGKECDSQGDPRRARVNSSAGIRTHPTLRDRMRDDRWIVQVRSRGRTCRKLPQRA